MKLTHPGWKQTQPIGVFHFCRSFADRQERRRPASVHRGAPKPRRSRWRAPWCRLPLVALILLVMSVTLSACQSGPERFPARLDAAAAQGLQGVLPLLTRSSRAAVEALSQSKGDQPNPFLPPVGGRPTKVLEVRAIEGAVVLRVSVADPATPDLERKSK